MSQEIALARCLKGAPAAIFLALVLHGGPQTTTNLCRFTGYSDKVVRQGLARLKQFGLAYNDSDLRAWYLLPGTQLLKQLQTAVATAVEPDSYRGSRPPAAPDLPARGRAKMELSTELSTGDVFGEETEDFSPTTEDITGSADGRSRTALENSACEEQDYAACADYAPESAVVAKDSAISAAQGARTPDGPTGAISIEAEEISGDVEDVSGEAVDFTGDAEESSPSRAPITAAVINPINIDQDATSKQAPTKNARAPSTALDSRQRALKAWLVRGGVAPNSPKMGDLLALNLDLKAVQAHVLERQACEAGLVNGRPGYGAGLLIRKLLDGDPPPPLRCQECLRLPDRLGMCGCDYEKIVKR